MDKFKVFFKNIAEYVGRMTPSQVMMLLGVVTGIIAGAFFAVGWVNDITYSRLYSNLDNTEAGEVIAYLNESRIPFQLSDGGGTISVPSDEVYKTRISLAAEGLPRSGSVGYSVFDQNNLGMTDFLLNLNFRRALEGELTRTIMQLNEVSAARVHIVMPKDRLFKQDQLEPTASVVLKFKSHSELSRQKIAGITHLVASSVEGLQPDKITIVDYDGNLLSSGRSADVMAGLSSNQLEVRQLVEKYLESKAQTMLDDVLGNGTAVIRVTADLDFQQLERTSEMYDPNTPSIRSEERVKSSNTSSDKAEEANESQQEDASETVVTNYELNKTVEHIVNAVGNIDRLSVAVLVDGVYAPVEGEDGSTIQVYQPRTQEDLDRLAAIVKNAVGFDQQRNDQIEMVNIPFDRQNLEQERDVLDSMYQRDFYLEVARKIGYVLLIALALFYLKKKSKKLFGALSQLLPPSRPVAKTMAPEPEPEPEPLPRIVPGNRKPRLVDEMQKTAEKDPEEITRVIKTMMSE
ncbi:MAG: flagellar basal-body MS-ring/collar protein FliF [bacterium]